MCELVAGVDEAGRGPLAGPVTAAAVILPAEHDISGLKDSKKLTATKRQDLALETKNTALSYSIVFVDSEKIDAINILKATLLAMSEAVLKLSVKPDKVLVDGNIALDIEPYNVEAIVRGDAKIEAISAASILAKVARDELMLEYDKNYPQYGFSRHKGYGTKEHMQALLEYGPCPLHRKSFAPVKNALGLF